MSQDDGRLDGGTRSVVGAELHGLHGGRGGRFDKGSGEPKQLEEDRVGRNGPVDPGSAGRGLRKPPEMSKEDFLRVSDVSDGELKEFLVAVEVYRMNGYSWPRVAKVMGMPAGLVQRYREMARQRKLTLPALEAARQEVEDRLVPMAMDTVAYHLKRHNLEAGLKTLTGVGVLRPNADAPDARLPMQLNVQIVDANGVIIQVGNKAPTLPGVMGVPKTHRLDLPMPKDEP